RTAEPRRGQYQLHKTLHSLVQWKCANSLVRRRESNKSANWLIVKSVAKPYFSIYSQNYSHSDIAAPISTALQAQRARDSPYHLIRHWRHNQRKGVKPMRSILAGCLLIFAASALATQPRTFTAGRAAYQVGDYATALADFRVAAGKGNPAAQFGLGVMYGMGHGVPQDYAKAAKWFRLAAQQGLAGAQSALGSMYDHGDGVPQDYAKAAKWFRLAAQQGLAGAQFRLGAMYIYGTGFPPNDVKAAMWYQMAAQEGNASAQAALGGMYESGQGVPQDYVEAYKWLDLSKASFKVGSDGYKVSDSSMSALAAKMTPAQVAQAQQDASAWWDAHQKD
ncbi:MAG: tetratricopeptide repeat protein, partial [Betaproteobacteria bacterium]|nr:tetratricopeptide repeat protein [Betaproteobacteria bacterium]